MSTIIELMSAELAAHPEPVVIMGKNDIARFTNDVEEKAWILLLGLPHEDPRWSKYFKVVKP
jgi:hypothetical protein